MVLEDQARFEQTCNQRSCECQLGSFKDIQHHQPLWENKFHHELHCTATRKPPSYKNCQYRSWQGCTTSKILKCKMIQPLQKTVQQLNIKIKHTLIQPNNLPSKYIFIQEKWKHVHTKTYIQMSIRAQFIIAQA